MCDNEEKVMNRVFSATEEMYHEIKKQGKTVIGAKVFLDFADCAMLEPYDLDIASFIIGYSADLLFELEMVKILEWSVKENMKVSLKSREELVDEILDRVRYMYEQIDKPDGKPREKMEQTLSIFETAEIGIEEMNVGEEKNYIPYIRIISENEELLSELKKVFPLGEVRSSGKTHFFELMGTKQIKPYIKTIFSQTKTQINRWRALWNFIFSYEMSNEKAEHFRKMLDKEEKP